MANDYFEAGKRRLLAELLSGTVRASLIDSASYTPDLSTDTWFSDIPGAAVAASAEITGKTVSGDGVFDGADTTFASVAAGPALSMLVIWIDSGVPSTSPLVALIDVFTSGVPVTPDGDDIVVQWPTAGILAL